GRGTPGVRRSGRNDRFAAGAGYRDGEPGTETDHARADTQHTTAASPRSRRLAGRWAAGSGEPGDRRKNRGSVDAAGGSHRAVEVRVRAQPGPAAIARRD